MAVRKLFEMQNDFHQKNPNNEGVCTVAALQWAKKCLELDRGIGSYDELGLSDHQLNALMAKWRDYDDRPEQQTAAMGLSAVGDDQVVSDIGLMQGIFENTAPHIGIFWNSFHTMGYRAGKGGAEFEWFDNNHGLYVADNAEQLRQEINAYMVNEYQEPIEGVRVVQV